MDFDEDRLDSAAVLGSWIAGLIRSAEYDGALMAPKLLSKAQVMAENASAEAVFKVRAIAAQIGWLETYIPVVAAQAVIDVELFLSSGAPKESIDHQLNVFEAYELGLLATHLEDYVIVHPFWSINPESLSIDPLRGIVENNAGRPIYFVDAFDAIRRPIHALDVARERPADG